MVCICLNVVVLAMYYEGQSQSYEDTLGLINIVFWAIFEVEIMHSVNLCKNGKMFYYVSEVYHFCYYQVMSPQFRYIYSINFEFTLSIIDVLGLHTTIRFAE